MGKKRTNDGREKQSLGPASRAVSHTALTNETPPGAQAPNASVAPPVRQFKGLNGHNSKKQKLEKLRDGQGNAQQPDQAASRKHLHKKLPRLPPNASVTKRPLHHPAIPTPFASSDHPKTLYISHSTSFIPTLKRIRRLLLEISKRQAQSQTSKNFRHRQQGRHRKPLAPNGRLAPDDVEREIAEAGRDKGGGIVGEEVYIKATGRAIERALRIGIHFQGESDCKVRVETGSVMAVDDIELRDVEHEGEKTGQAKGDSSNEDVPETRVRMVSSVTVAVSLK